MLVTFEEWTQGRTILTLGTNNGAHDLPFQRWKHIKEAFAPELVARAISERHIPVRRCLDPFGGSGTMALACQFLGIHPITVEVNPFLADLIKAKLAAYSADALARDLRAVVVAARKQDPSGSQRRAVLSPQSVQMVAPHLTVVTLPAPSLGGEPAWADGPGA